MRIWNRAAQGYLIRPHGSPPGVLPPGADLADTNWQLPRQRSGGTDIVSTSPPFGSLRVDDSKLVLAAAEAAGAWLDADAGDGYIFLLNAQSPLQALAVDGAGALILTSERDRAAMWQLQEECVADARSVHLRYQTRKGTALFYNEVSVDDVTPGTYFCTSGFGANSRAVPPSGYGGIQLRPDGTKVAIFSVWHRMVGEITTVGGAAAKAVTANPAAHVVAFSGEGSGASIRLPLDWRTNEPVRYLMTAQAAGDDTVVAAFVAPGSSPWIDIGVIVRESTGGALMGNHYAFIEDYLRNGNSPGVVAADRSPYRVHSAEFANPWHATPSSALLPVEAATVTAFGPHPLESIGAEIRSTGRFGIHVRTGGLPAPVPPPIGATFKDSATSQRVEPALGGVPASWSRTP